MPKITLETKTFIATKESKFNSANKVQLEKKMKLDRLLVWQQS